MISDIDRALAASMSKLPTASNRVQYVSGRIFEAEVARPIAFLYNICVRVCQLILFIGRVFMFLVHQVARDLTSWRWNPLHESIFMAYMGIPAKLTTARADSDDRVQYGTPLHHLLND